MGRGVLNINTDATVVFTDKLEELHRSALPSAVRGSLNRAVFDVKTKTMPDSANREFVNRSKNFFKGNSRFKNAKGFDMATMKSTVGFVEARLRGSNNFAVQNLEQQEVGGEIGGRSFKPYITSRPGKNRKKLVSPRNRLSNIKKIVNAKNVSGSSKKQKFIKAVFTAGKGGFVLSEFKGTEVLWRVNSLRRTVAGKFKLTPLYKFEKGGTVKINKPTHFMQKASVVSSKKIEQFYVIEAKRQIKKFR